MAGVTHDGDARSTQRCAMRTRRRLIGAAALVLAAGDRAADGARLRAPSDRSPTCSRDPAARARRCRRRQKSAGASSQGAVAVPAVGAGSARRCGGTEAARRARAEPPNGHAGTAKAVEAPKASGRPAKPAAAAPRAAAARRHAKTRPFARAGRRASRNPGSAREAGRPGRKTAGFAAYTETVADPAGRRALACGSGRSPAGGRRRGARPSCKAIGVDAALDSAAAMT